MKKLVAIIAVVLGIVFVVCGFAFHRRTVRFDEEVQVEAPPLELDPFAPMPDEPPPDSSPETVPVLEERETVEPEHRLVLEASRGGVARLPDGTIKRTYIAGEGPPLLCPT